MNAIELSSISKSYGTNLVLKDISLQLESGKFYALLGKNGVGKSTLMRLLMRYEHPDQGTARVLGQSLEDDSDSFNAQIGYVSEILDYALPLPLGKLFSYFKELYPRWDQGMFDRTLSELRLQPEKYFRDLSRGQKMQVAFAAAIAIHPKLLLLDEITAVLDSHVRSHFMRYLSEFTKAGGTVLMATNILSEIQCYADHLILLDEGRVRISLPIPQIGQAFVKLRKIADHEHSIFSDPACIQVTLNSDNSISYLLPRSAAAQKTIPVELLDRRGITVEELFIGLTKSANSEAK